jgi:ABC-type amino acid transport system permease subunit
VDAIHVASAYRIRSMRAAFVSYDTRQFEAAEALGLPITSPR